MTQKKIISEAKVFEYLRSQLSLGKTLSSLVSLLSLEEGHVHSFAHLNRMENSLNKFNEGGNTNQNSNVNSVQPGFVPIINESKSIIQRQISEYLLKDNNNCCIFEDSTAQPNDSWVKNSKIEFVHLRDAEIYYFFDYSNNNLKKIKKAFVASEGYYFFCVLSSLDKAEHLKFRPFNEITSSLLKSIADNTVSFFVSAYDKEGYLMWSR